MIKKNRLIGVFSLAKWADAAAIKRDIRQLIDIADHASSIRRLDIVGDIASRLQSFSVPEGVAEFYSALTMPPEFAERMLLKIADNAPPQYRARALTNVASINWHDGDVAESLRLYDEARKISPTIDPFVETATVKIAAIAMSLHGDHAHAVRHLESEISVARAVCAERPALFLNYLNSLAVELCEVGRLEEADNVSRIVLASPFASAYPEWRETSNEIALRGRRPSRATVAFSQSISEAKDHQPIRRRRSADDLAASQGIPESKNLVRLPVPEHSDSFNEPPSASEPAAVLDMQEWKEKLTKRSNRDPQDKISRPTTEKDIQARLMELRKMGTRERLVRLMTLAGDEEITDDELLRALIILEGLEPDEKKGS